jgi:hypothetical protein
VDFTAKIMLEVTMSEKARVTINHLLDLVSDDEITKVELRVPSEAYPHYELNTRTQYGIVQLLRNPLQGVLEGVMGRVQVQKAEVVTDGSLDDSADITDVSPKAEAQTKRPKRGRPKKQEQPTEDEQPATSGYTFDVGDLGEEPPNNEE